MKNPNRLLFVAVVLSLIHTFAFAAEAINIDIGIVDGSPFDAYGAGSEQTGAWNAVSALGTPVNLVRTSGAPSNATVVVTGRIISWYGWGWATDPRRFFVDMMYEDRPDQVWTLTVSGLENGQYDIFYYTTVAFPTGVMTINGIQVPSLPGNPESQILRLTRGVSFDVLQAVEVTDGTLEMIDVSDEGLTGLTGIQIVPHRQNLPNPFLLTSSHTSENITEIDSSGNRVLGPTVLDGGVNVWATTGGDHDPVYIAWGPSGELFAVYGNTDQIRRYSETGIDLGAFVSTGLVDPISLTFDAAGILYITHGHDLTRYGTPGKVTRYDSTGTFIDDFVTGLQYPSDLAFDGLGNLYVAERYLGQVQKFDSAGNPIVLISGFTDPLGLAVDRDDNLYVADATRNIQRFDPNGAPLGIFGSVPTGYSYSLRFGPLGNLYLATGDHVYSWQADGTPKGVFGDAYGTGLAFSPGDGSPGNEPPTAAAGTDQAIRAGNDVVLDGSGSFDDNTPTAGLTYAWSFLLKPEGSTANLSGADTAFPNFVADLEGVYTVQLIVTDEDALSSAPDTVDISSDNLAPQAVAGGDQLVIVGSLVALDGSGSSDPENDPLTFYWTITSAPAGSVSALNGADTATADFVPDLEGLYVVTLMVSDAIGPGAADALQITVSTAVDFAATLIIQGGDHVAALDANLGEVRTVGNQNAFGNFLSQAIIAIQAGDIAEAIAKLEKAIERTDGCALRGSPDGNGRGRDWISHCSAQAEIYGNLTDALDLLTS